MLNSDDFAIAIAKVQQNLEKTNFAWFGPTKAGSAAYFRVTGPSVLIEFSTQAQDGDAADHTHNMYRDPSNDYGAAWAKLK